MIQQNLTYYVSSSTSVLTNSNNVIEKIFYNSSCSISGEAISTGVNHSGESAHDHDVTTRIRIYSGSYVVASLPYHKTNYFIDSSFNSYGTSSNTIEIIYKIISDNTNIDTDYYFKIVNSSSLEENVNVGLLPGENIGNIYLTSSSIYSIELYAGTNKYNYIYVNDDTNTLLYSSSWSGSQTQVTYLYPTSSTAYNITASVLNSLCCSPILLSASLYNTNQIQFDFETGSCGVCTDIIVYKSTNSLDYKYLISGSTSSPIYSLSGSYPLVPTLYYIVQKCGTFSSDKSNVIGLIPDVIVINY